MSDRQDADFIERDDKAIKRDVARLPVGDDQFPQLSFDSSADERMRGQILDRRTNRGDGVKRRVRILVAQELKGALDVIQSAC